MPKVSTKPRNRKRGERPSEARRRAGQGQADRVFWTIDELAGRYACSPWTIRRFIAEGRLDVTFIGPHMPRIPDASRERFEQEAPSHA